MPKTKTITCPHCQEKIIMSVDDSGVSFSKPDPEGKKSKSGDKDFMENIVDWFNKDE